MLLSNRSQRLWGSKLPLRTPWVARDIFYCFSFPRPSVCSIKERGRKRETDAFKSPSILAIWVQNSPVAFGIVWSVIMQPFHCNTKQCPAFQHYITKPAKLQPLLPDGIQNAWLQFQTSTMPRGPALIAKHRLPPTGHEPSSTTHTRLLRTGRGFLGILVCSLLLG